ncbi:FliM/FliN family flagellar motor switch protein [Sphingosinicella microcystinivorans]|uniref:FliM/FliN family flagellar motor switch protein n=1 Tax=Sphingosinicella microcystinivorans TaxID=335406 RepID=UPI0022F3E82C|nr:FliM/FliN family flagellar motor switch protein [Sphingosinicella microcystinivorans]WBX85718.1 FliM/FliN family flagellar motor switch protein [Sphingosinicella microcystinivorans]
MSVIERIKVEISVVIGSKQMPIRQLLKMGRGAVIDLDARRDDPVWIYANDELIARGEIVLLGDRIGVSISERVRRAGGLNLSSSVI